MFTALVAEFRGQPRDRPEAVRVPSSRQAWQRHRAAGCLRQYNNSCRLSPTMSATRRKTSPPQIVGEAKTIVPSWFFETCSNPFGVALPRKASQPKMTNPTKPAVCKALRESAGRCEGAVSGLVVPTGFEPGDATPIQSQDLRQTPNQRAAECAAVGDDLPPIDPDLAIEIDAWHSLPPDTRTAILAIVEAAQGR